MNMLYLIESQGFLKIGFSDNIDKRIDSYHTENPNFKVLNTREGDRKDESYLHFLFKDYIDHREWIKYEEFIVNLFPKIKLPSEMKDSSDVESLKKTISKLSKSNEILQNKINEYKEMLDKSHDLTDRCASLTDRCITLLEDYNQSIKEYNDHFKS